MSFAAFTCFALAGVLTLWMFMVWRGMSQDWLPAELKAARLVHVEEDLVVDEPFPVIGRPDQVYRLADGAHVPVELKNRARHSIYDTDIAEISLRAWLLRRSGKATAAHGYVVINSRETGRREATKVELRNDAFCERLIERYIDVVEGRVAARKSRGAKCRSCGHVARCQTPTN